MADAVSRVTKEDAPELRRLWKLVFDDDDRFIDSFFQNLFCPDHCLVTRGGGSIVSMLFMLGGTLSADVESPIYYIYACATRPEYRRQGLMGKLLEEAVRYADSNGSRLALVPENEKLAAYYRQFGFAQETFLYRRKFPPLSVSKSPSDWVSLPLEGNSHELLLGLRARFWRGRNAVLWPEAHLKVTLDEVSFQNGEMLVMKTATRLAHGYALAVPRKGMVEIIECATIWPQEETIQSLRNHYREHTILFSLSEGVADSCAQKPFALFYTSNNDSVPYLNLALDF